MVCKGLGKRPPCFLSLKPDPVSKVSRKTNARAVLFVLTALVALVFFPPYFGGLSVHWAAGTFGATVSRQGTWDVTAVSPGSPAWAAGMRGGDRVLAGPFSTEMARLAWPRAGDRLAVAFRHPGGNIVRASLTAVKAAPIEPWEWAVTLAGLAVLVTFLTIAVLLVYSRPGVMTWSFYAYAVGFFPTMGPLAFYHDRLPYPAYIALVFILGTVLGNIVAMPLLPFVLRFPNDRLNGWRKPVDRVVWVAIAAAYCAYVFQWFYVRELGGALSWSATLDEWLPLAVFAAAAWIVLKNYKESDPTVRQRTGFLILGALTSFVAYAVYFIPGIDIVVQTVVSYLVVLLPITVAYAVLRHRVLDINFVLNRAIAYGTLSVVVIVVVTLLDWLSGQVVSKAHFATVIEIVVTVGIGFGLTRINRALESFIDLLLFRRRHEAERYLARVADALPYATAEDAISDGLVREPVEALSLIAGALYRRSEDGRIYQGVATSSQTTVAPMGFDRNHNLVRFLQSAEDLVWLGEVRSHLDAANSAVYALAVPVTVRHQLVSFVLYGAHLNGAQIDPDEVVLLKKLAREAARAYDHVDAVRMRELMARATSIPLRTT